MCLKSASAGNQAYLFYGIGGKYRLSQPCAVHRISVTDIAGGSCGGCSFYFVKIYNHAIVFDSHKYSFACLFTDTFQVWQCNAVNIVFAQVRIANLLGLNIQKI